MRIISGNFKGKKIIEPKDKKTRPLKPVFLQASSKFKVDKEILWRTISSIDNFFKLFNSIILFFLKPKLKFFK